MGVAYVHLCTKGIYLPAGGGGGGGGGYTKASPTNL